MALLICSHCDIIPWSQYVSMKPAWYKAARPIDFEYGGGNHDIEKMFVSDVSNAFADETTINAQRRDSRLGLPQMGCAVATQIPC